MDINNMYAKLYAAYTETEESSEEYKQGYYEGLLDMYILATGRRIAPVIRQLMSDWAIDDG